MTVRILQINTVCGYGSTGRIATDIDFEIKKNGWESKIAFARYEAPQGVETIKIGNKIDFYFHVAITRAFDKHCYGSKRATKALIKEIMDYDPDIIHLHNLHGYYLNLEILFDYLKSANKKIVWTLHDCWPMSGHCAYFDFIQCEKWKTQCFKCPQKSAYPASKLIDNSACNYETKKNIFRSIKDINIVTPSNWLKTVVEQSFLFEHKVQVIYNGVDSEIFKPTNTVLNRLGDINLEGKFVLLGVASLWEERKGLNDFIELSKIIDEDIKIILVGLSNQQLENLPPNVIGVRRTRDIRELAQLYNRADIFVNPSSEETFGMVTVEAMACGTPVIVYNATASPELVEIGCGEVVVKNDVQGIHEAVKKIRAKGKGSYSSTCRKTVIEKYDKNKQVKKYIELYRNLI